MTLMEKLAARAESGQGQYSRTNHGEYYTTHEDLGTWAGVDYSLAATVRVLAPGETFCHAQIWAGEVPAPQAPVQVNWPRVKAFRELLAGHQTADVVERLLQLPPT